jgi:hypothetical protein
MEPELPDSHDAAVDSSSMRAICLDSDKRGYRSIAIRDKKGNVVAKYLKVKQQDAADGEAGEAGGTRKLNPNYTRMLNRRLAASQAAAEARVRAQRIVICRVGCCLAHCYLNVCLSPGVAGERLCITSGRRPKCGSSPHHAGRVRFWGEGASENGCLFPTVYWRGLASVDDDFRTGVRRVVSCSIVMYSLFRSELSARVVV